MDIKIDLFASGDQIQNFFGLKGLQIKMSPVLNIVLYIVDNKEQNWFKRAHIGRYLGIARIIISTAKLPKENIRSQAFLQPEG